MSSAQTVRATAEKGKALVERVVNGQHYETAFEDNRFLGIKTVPQTQGSRSRASSQGSLDSLGGVVRLWAGHNLASSKCPEISQLAKLPGDQLAEGRFLG